MEAINASSLRVTGRLLYVTLYVVASSRIDRPLYFRVVHPPVEDRIIVLLKFVGVGAKGNVIVNKREGDVRYGNDSASG